MACDKIHGQQNWAKAPIRQRNCILAVYCPPTINRCSSIALALKTRKRGPLHAYEHRRISMEASTNPAPSSMVFDVAHGRSARESCSSGHVVDPRLREVTVHSSHHGETTLDRLAHNDAAERFLGSAGWAGT